MDEGEGERKIRRRIRSSRFARRRSKGQRRVIGIFRAVIGDMLLGGGKEERGGCSSNGCSLVVNGLKFYWDAHMFL